MSLKEKFSKHPKEKFQKQKNKNIYEKIKIVDKINQDVNILKKDESEIRKENIKDFEFFIFEIDNNILAIELKYISEILELQYITPVPLTKDFFLGLINVRNEIVSVIDLYNFLLNKWTPHNANNKIVLINFNNIKCGIIANKIIGIFNCSKNEIIKNIENVEISYKQYLNCILNYKDFKVPVLDIEKIFESESFNKVE